MRRSIRTLAELIYSEFIEYTIDYIEDEISFESALINLDRIKRKLNEYVFDVEGQLLIAEFEIMESILALFLLTSIEIHEEKDEEHILEARLTKNLIDLINNYEENISSDEIGGILNEYRPN